MEANPNCAVVAPIIYNGLHSDRTNNMGFNLSYKYLIPLDFSKLTGNCKKWIAQKTRKVNWVSDTVALMRRSAICRVGGYDEQYFMYGQMTDMGYRLKQHGYDLIVNYDAVAYHTGRGSSGNKLSGFSLYYKLRNWIIFQRKYFKKSHLVYTALWSIGAMFMYGFKALIHGNLELILDMSKGIRDGFSYDIG
jgi:GT2 family glycosyltransferase